MYSFVWCLVCVCCSQTLDVHFIFYSDNHISHIFVCGMAVMSQILFMSVVRETKVSLVSLDSLESGALGIKGQRYPFICHILTENRTFHVLMSYIYIYVLHSHYFVGNTVFPFERLLAELQHQFEKLV